MPDVIEQLLDLRLILPSSALRARLIPRNEDGSIGIKASHFFRTVWHIVKGVEVSPKTHSELLIEERRAKGGEGDEDEGGKDEEDDDREEDEGVGEDEDEDEQDDDGGKDENDERTRTRVR